MTTQEQLKAVFDYKDGYLIYKIPGPNRKVGRVAGHLDKRKGYWTVGLHGKLYQAHRLIYLYHHGWLPEALDHINRVRTDNRIENLRPATNQQNQYNKSSFRDSSSKYKGVSWKKQRNKWTVQISIAGKKTHLGYFDCEGDAAMAYNEAALEHFGIFAGLNESPGFFKEIRDATK